MQEAPSPTELRGEGVEWEEKQKSSDLLRRVKTSEGHAPGSDTYKKMWLNPPPPHLSPLPDTPPPRHRSISSLVFRLLSRREWRPRLAPKGSTSRGSS